MSTGFTMFEDFLDHLFKDCRIHRPNKFRYRLTATKNLNVGVPRTPYFSAVHWLVRIFNRANTMVSLNSFAYWWKNGSIVWQYEQVGE
jgi:hypothetical protein